MIYLLYLIMVPINLLVTVLCILLSPILPIFATQQEGWLDNRSKYGIGPRLPKWLSWFQTPDNSLDGDAAFEKNNPPSYLSKIKWLIRNPGYGFGVFYLKAPYATSYKGDPTIKDNDNAKAGYLFVRANHLFQFVWITPIGFQRCFYLNLGWNIRGLVDANINPKPDPWEATFAFSPRISGFR
jgi:hypothetical protein